MLQLNMLAGDVESLRVPVEIEKMVIDTDKHEQMLKSNPSGIKISLFTT